MGPNFKIEGMGGVLRSRGGAIVGSNGRASSEPETFNSPAAVHRTEHQE